MNEQDSQNENVFRSGMVAIVGPPNSGKSTLLNRFLGQKISITAPKPQTTRNRILGVAHCEQAQVVYLDTPGLHQARGKLHHFMLDQALQASREVDVVLALISAVQARQEPELLKQILTSCAAPKVLALNKIDLLEPAQLLPIIDYYRQHYQWEHIIPISALRGEGTEQLQKELIRLLPQGPPYFPEDTITDMPERFVVAELVREQLLRQLQQEVPHGTAVVVESFEERPQQDLVVIHAAIVVLRASHKKIVIGHNGSRIRSIGRGAREQIERLLATRVYLELFVRVEENWTESPQQLAELGYSQRHR